MRRQAKGARLHQDGASDGNAIGLNADHKIDPNAEALVDSYLAKVCDVPVCVIRDTRLSQRPLWEFLRRAAGLVIREKWQQKADEARREWRMIGVMAWFVVLTMMLFARDQIDMYVISIAAIGAYAQWQSTSWRSS